MSKKNPYIYFNISYVEKNTEGIICNLYLKLTEKELSKIQLLCSLNPIDQYSTNYPRGNTRAEHAYREIARLIKHCSIMQIHAFKIDKNLIKSEYNDAIQELLETNNKNIKFYEIKNIFKNPDIFVKDYNSLLKYN